MRKHNWTLGNSSYYLALLLALLMTPWQQSMAGFICANQQLDAPYDLSGTHSWGGEILVNRDQIMESCEDLKDFRKLLKPRNVTVVIPPSSLSLALDSVEIDGLTATLNYTGTLTLATSGKGTCEARAACENSGAIIPIWRGPWVDEYAGTIKYSHTARHGCSFYAENIHNIK